MDTQEGEEGHLQAKESGCRRTPDLAHLHAGTLTLNFGPLKLRENKLLLFQASICGTLSGQPRQANKPRFTEEETEGHKR